MAQVEWAFLCDYAFKAQGGKMCLIGIFHSIFAHGVPVTHPQAALALRINGAAGEKVPIKISINRPTGTSLARVTGEMNIGHPPPDVDVSSLMPGGEIHFNMANMLLPDYGTYSIDIYLGDEPEPARTVPFTVNRPPKPAAGAH